MVKSYSALIAFLIIGLLIIGFVQLLHLSSSVNSIIILSLFLLLNFSTAWLLKIKENLANFWALRKTTYLPIGVICGVLIASLPILGELTTGRISFADIHFNKTLSITTVIFTFITVFWEELWFRGIVLNYSRKYLSSINLSISTGLLFLIAHTLNPELDLLKTGTTLFFAGAFLTLVYFQFETIWLPLGIHLGNNLNVFETNNSNDWFFGQEGLLNAIVLAILFLLLAIFSRYSVKHFKHNTQNSSQ